MADDERLQRFAVVPPVVDLRLPRSLTVMLMDIGEKLLVPDQARGDFVVNGEIALKFALILNDDDLERAQRWLSRLQEEYNKYVKEALQGHGNGPVCWIP